MATERLLAKILLRQGRHLSKVRFTLSTVVICSSVLLSWCAWRDKCKLTFLSFAHLCLIKHLTDVFNDDGDDEVGDGDGDHEDEEHEQCLDDSVAAADVSHRLKGEIVVKVELSHHHRDRL